MLVSVVVPTYNAVKFLDNTLQSIINQTYSSLEILVIDDGSSDNTADLVKHIKDDRIRFIELEHQGAPGHCRNHGLQIAKGELLIYFDSDDYMEPTMIEKMVALYKQNQVDIVICMPRYFDIVNNKVVTNEHEAFMKKETYELNDLFEINPFPCNKLYRKEFLLESNVTYLEGVFNQDLGYFLSLLFHRPSFTICKEQLMEYRIRPNSITTSLKTRKKHRDILAVFNQVFMEYEKYPCLDLKQGLEKMFIKTMLFKIGFFDPLKDKEDIENIRKFLYKNCPLWYKHKGFKEYYSFKKQIYNILLVHFKLYNVIGLYKAIKRR